MPKHDDEKHKQALENSGPFKAAFHCRRCDIKWISNDSWPNTLQHCRRCKTGIPPEIHRTPYQGKGRRYGDFSCNNCGTTWSSAYSWANSYQQCKKCLKHVYPKIQRKLLKSGDDVENKKPHHQKLCGKCQELGHSCRLLQEREVEGEALATAFQLQGQRAGETVTNRRTSSYGYSSVHPTTTYESMLSGTRRDLQPQGQRAQGNTTTAHGHGNAAAPSRVAKESTFPRRNVKPEETASDSPSFLEIVGMGIGAIILWRVYSLFSN